MGSKINDPLFKGFPEELDLRGQSASPLILSFFHAWIVTGMCLSVRNVSVGLKYVRITKIESWLSLSPVKTVVSRKIISVLEISAVNLMVGRCLLA